MSTPAADETEVQAKFRLIEKARPLVIALDDDPIALQIVKETAIESGFKCLAGTNGQEGLSLFKSEGPAACYVVDLHMPVMDGPQFILKLREEDPEAVIIIQTVEDRPEAIVDVMKLGVYDWFFKPVNPDLFTVTLNRAWEHKKLVSMKKSMDEQAAMKLRSQLEWLTYKEERRESGSHAQERNLIYNLMTSMNQGAGFGSLLTMIDLLRMKGKRPDDKTYAFPADLVERLFHLSELSRQMVEGLESILELIEKDFEKNRHTMTEVNSILEEMDGKFQPYAASRGVALKTNGDDSNIELTINVQKTRLAIEELFLNAIKYTPEGGQIDAYTHSSGTYGVISVMNDVSETGGIPSDFEKLVIEPFIRLHPPVEMAVKEERFGLGLGLSVINHIARKHGGLFFIQEVKDHTSGMARRRVLAELFLPIAGSKERK